MARPPMRPRSVKVDDDLWLAAHNAAAVLRTDVSTEIRASLRALVRRAARQPGPTALHHINGNPYDNRPENLQIVDLAAHARTAPPADTEEA
jgi:hypothetical protein